ncbi:MAG: GAF domain-containing sensor histidine kinase, partial [Actinotalea sp.]|nr:GAF domain-containing sensor histidine kinase [Actinotalea sp.]
MAGFVDVEVRIDDAARTARIEEYGVLRGGPRRDLKALVDLAAQVTGVRHAAINIITADEQHQIVTAALEPSVCSREDSMCAAVLAAPDLVMVRDASRDDRFADNPFVTGRLGAVRFYASTPLVTPGDVVIGRLCVFDDAPRTVTPAQQDALRSLAARVVDVLELGLRTRQLEATVSELTAARNELRRSNEHLSVFAGQVAHDLRTPLTAILANAEVLALELERAPELAPFVEATLESGQRMSDLIADYLAYARVGADLRVEDVDLGVVVEAALVDLRPATTGTDVVVGPLPVVRGDRAQLYGVVLNLLANALKFTRPGQAPSVRVAARRRGDRWRVEVRDRGPGVPVERREEVFGLFARADSERAGHGIGLATARRVV